MNYRHEVSAGFELKKSNNNLQAGGNVVLQNSDTEIAQFVAEYSGLVPDRYRRASIGGEFYYSPGDMTPENTDAAFNLLRTAAKANSVMRASIWSGTRPCRSVSPGSSRAGTRPPASVFCRAKNSRSAATAPSGDTTNA